MKKVFSIILAGLLFTTLALPALAAADTKAPGDVEGLAVNSVGDKEVSLKWKAAKDDVGVKGYQIHYGLKTVNQKGQTYDKSEDVGNVLEYTVKNLENDKKYYFSAIAYDEAKNESQRWATEISATPSASGTNTADTIAPQVAAGEALNKQEVKVVFSEEVVLPKEDPQDSFAIEHEETFEPLVVSEAKMDEEDKDNKTVILTTALQEENASYKLTVGIDVKDKAGNPIISGTSDTAVFTGSALEKPAQDITGPQVVKVEAVDVTHILVNFNETVVLDIDPAKNFKITAEDDPLKELVVLGVKLGVNTDAVENSAAVITTAPQGKMKYLATVSGLKDEAGNAVDATKNSAMFMGLGVDPVVTENGDTKKTDIVAPKDIAKFMAKKVMEAEKYMVKLTWDLPKEGREDVVTQNLYLSSDKGGNYTEKATLQPEVKNYDAKDLTAGEYWFKLTQKDAAGNESKGVITKVILSETGPEMIGLVGLSLVFGRVVARRKKK